MEKNKKAKIFIVVMSFFLVITFVATCSLTLSFFGSSASSSTTIRLGNAVEVEGSPITLSTGNLYVLPSQKVTIKATANVTSSGSGDPTPALLRARINVISTVSGITLSIENPITIDGASCYWVRSQDDGYYYFMSSNSQTGVLSLIKPGTSGKSVPLNINVSIPDSLSNNDNSKDYRVSVTFCAIQGLLYNAGGSGLISNTIANTKNIFNTIDSASSTSSNLSYIIEGNSVPDVSPWFNSPAILTSVGEGSNKTITITHTGASTTNYTIDLTGHEPLRRISDSTYDYIDSASGVIVRNIASYSFTGNEAWSYKENTDSSGNKLDYISLYMNNSALETNSGITFHIKTINSGIWCSHVPYVQSSVNPYYQRTTVGVMGYNDATAAFMFTIPKSIASNSTEWKQYLKDQASAGTPVTIWFVLATAVTETITCPTIPYVTDGTNSYSVSSSGVQPILNIKNS